MASTDVIRRLQIQLEMRGLSEGAAALGKIVSAGGDIESAFAGATKTMDRTAEGTASVARRFKSVEQAVSPAVKEMDRFGGRLNAILQYLDQFGDKPGTIERVTAAIQGLIQGTNEYKNTARDLLAEQARVDAAMEDYSGRAKKRVQDQIAYEERLAQLRHEQASANFGSDVRQLTGVDRKPATQQGATFSALEDQFKRDEMVAQAFGEQTAKEFTRGFNESLRIGMKATDYGATFSALDEEMQRQEDIAKAHASHIAALSQQNIATLTGQNRTPATANGATFSALADQADKLERSKRLINEMLEKADPLGQEMERLTQAQKAYAAALASKDISPEQFTKLTEYSAQRIDVLKRNLGNDGLAGSLKLSATQWQNLGFQINDVITMASMGAPALQIAASQAGQFYQVLAGARGGLAGGLTAVKEGFLRLLTPANLVMGGLAAGAVTAYAAWSRYNDSIKEVERSLIGLGRGTEATVGQLSKIAEGSAGGAGMSVREARSAVSTLASTGRISTQVYGDLLKSARDYAVVVGEDVPTATKELAQALRDPVRGADILNEKFNLFNAEQLKTIKRLAETGNRVEAQKELVAAYTQVVSGAADKTSLWDRALNSVGSTLSNLMDKIGKFISAPGPAEQIESQLKRIEQVRKALENAQKAGQGNGPWFGLRMTDQRRLERSLGTQEQNLYGLQTDVREQERARFLEQRRANVNDLSNAMEKITSGMDPFNENIERLQKNIDALTAGLKSSFLNDLPEKQVERMTEALDFQKRALEQQKRYGAAGGQQYYEGLKDSRFSVDTAGMTDLERSIAEINKRYQDQLEIARATEENTGRLTAAEKSLKETRDNELEALRRQANMATARQYVPEAFQQSDIQQRLDIFTSKRDSLRAQGLNDPLIDKVIERLRTQLENLKTPIEKMLTNYKLEQDSINAVTFEQKAQVEAQKAYNATLDQFNDKATAAVAKQLAYNNAIQQSVRQAYDALKEARDSAALVGLRPAQREQAQIAQEARRQRETSAPQAWDTINQTEALKKWQAAEEAMRGPLQEANDNIREQVANVRIAAETYGKTTAEIAAAAAKQDLLNQYMREGITVTPQLRQKIEEYGQAAGRAASYTEGVRKAQQTMDDVKSAGQDALKGFISDLRNGTDAGQAFLNMLNKITDKLIDMMLNSLFDTSGTGGSIWQLLSNPSKFFEVLSGKGAPSAANVGSINAMPNSALPNLSTVPLSATINQEISGSLVPAFKTAAQSIGEATPQVVQAYIQSAALSRGIDPTIASRVFKQESSFNPGAIGDNGTSFGVTQLHVGGGLGDRALAQGIDIRDPATWRQQVDFSLDYAKQHGWGSWYGARDSGVSNWQGINTQPIQASVQKVSQSVDGLSKTVMSGGQDVGSSLTDTASLVTKGGDGLGNAFTEAAQKLSSSGGGGFGGLGSLFGGGGGGSTDWSGFVTGVGNYDYTFMHDGGLVGRDVTFTRKLPSSVFDGAPRFHSGLRPDEIPAVLQAGEWVLSRDDVASIRNGGHMGAPANSNGGPRVTVINNGPTQATAKENPDGSVDVIVEALENQMADRAARGKGALYKASTSRADGRALRG